VPDAKGFLLSLHQLGERLPEEVMAHQKLLEPAEQLQSELLAGHGPDMQHRCPQ